jgi:hypothetical protein
LSQPAKIVRDSAPAPPARAATGWLADGQTGSVSRRHADGQAGRGDPRDAPGAQLMTIAVLDHAPGNAPPTSTQPVDAIPRAVSSVTPRPRYAAETARLYAADWTAFTSWCANAGRRAAAIAHRHRQAGFSSPAADPAVRDFLRAARRAAPPRHAAARRHPPLSSCAWPPPARVTWPGCAIARGCSYRRWRLPPCRPGRPRRRACLRHCNRGRTRRPPGGS